jgi:hypothetical protein
MRRTDDTEHGSTTMTTATLTLTAGRTFTVTRTCISTARKNYFIYTAWSPTDGRTARFGTIASLGQDGYFGRIGTKRPGKRITDLPAGSAERKAAAQEWYQTAYEVAYEIILRAYPEAADGKRTKGEIEVESGSWARGESRTVEF